MTLTLLEMTINSLSDELSVNGWSKRNDSPLSQPVWLTDFFFSAVLGTVLDHMTKEGIVGKREFSFFDTIRGHVSNGIELVKKVNTVVTEMELFNGGL